MGELQLWGTSSAGRSWFSGGFPPAAQRTSNRHERISRSQIFQSMGWKCPFFETGVRLCAAQPGSFRRPAGQRRRLWSLLDSRAADEIILSTCDAKKPTHLTAECNLWSSDLLFFFFFCSRDMNSLWPLLDSLNLSCSTAVTQLTDATSCQREPKGISLPSQKIAHWVLGFPACLDWQGASRRAAARWKGALGKWDTCLETLNKNFSSFQSN